jgi:hypothetical protein
MILHLSQAFLAAHFISYINQLYIIYKVRYYHYLYAMRATCLRGSPVSCLVTVTAGILVS